MTNNYTVGETVIISRESKGKVITSESARVITIKPNAIYVRLSNGDVIKRKYRQVQPTSGGTKE